MLSNDVLLPLIPFVCGVILVMIIETLINQLKAWRRMSRMKMGYPNEALMLTFGM